MKTIAITGGPASGKSWSTTFLKEYLEKKDFKVKVFDYDAVVKTILKYNAFDAPLNIMVFPDKNIGENREEDMKLFRDIIIFGRKEKEMLDKIVQMMMSAAYALYYDIAEKEKIDFLLLDMPLLYETPFVFKRDVSICVTVDEEIQHKRLLERGLNEEEANSIVNQQLSQREKAIRSDFVFEFGSASCNTSSTECISHFQTWIENIVSSCHENI